MTKQVFSATDSLDRFLKQQERVYPQALQELQMGEKSHHFIWYIFPQLRGLGRSATAFIYGIGSIREAREYLAHPILGARLIECCEALLRHQDKSAKEIFGLMDTKKLRSCMTLFAALSPADSVFHAVLDCFFGGHPCDKTAHLLANSEACHIENGVLLGYYGEKEELIVPAGVTAVHPYAFYKRAHLKRVVLPDSVTQIGRQAFARCYHLEQVTVPPYTNIGESAFGGCPYLADHQGFVVINGVLSDYMGKETNVSIPQGVLVIGASAFRRCREVETVHIPDSVVVIDDYAFCGCFGLKDIALSEYVASIGRGVFIGCRKLARVTVHPDNETYHSHSDCLIETAAKTLITACDHSVIPGDGSVAHIGQAAFAGRVNLTRLSIPDTVTTIGPWAFDTCKNVQEIDIPDSVTVIGTGAFARCENLTLIVGENGEAEAYAMQYGIPYRHKTGKEG